MTVVELDDLAAADVEGLATRLGTWPGVAVGIARRRLGSTYTPVLEALTTTLSTYDLGATTVVVDDPDSAAHELFEGLRTLGDVAVVVVQVLRAATPSDLTSALWIESLAYSTALGGRSFASWRGRTALRPPGGSADAVEISRCENLLRVVLDRPERRNALDAVVRRDLSAALDIAIADPGLRIELSGRGPDFCSGGDLDEFGSAADLLRAHVLRLSSGPATRMLELGPRTTAIVHGSCVGSGVELAAFAHRVVAAPGTTFRLPELRMGLLPGAGGTVSVRRRIGRWRTAWLVLSGETLGLDRAVSWGLVDDVQ